MRLLVGGDGRLVTEGEADLVETVEEHVARAWWGLEPFGVAAVGEMSRDCLLAQVHFHLALPRGEEPPGELFGDFDGQQAVLVAVLAEDVGEASGRPGARSDANGPSVLG